MFFEKVFWATDEAMYVLTSCLTFDGSISLLDLLVVVVGNWTQSCNETNKTEHSSRIHKTNILEKEQKDLEIQESNVRKQKEALFKEQKVLEEKRNSKLDEISMLENQEQEKVKESMS